MLRGGLRCGLDCVVRQTALWRGLSFGPDCALGQITLRGGLHCGREVELNCEPDCIR